jgi:hypothetical protein
LKDISSWQLWLISIALKGEFIFGQTMVFIILVVSTQSGSLLSTSKFLSLSHISQHIMGFHFAIRIPELENKNWELISALIQSKKMRTFGEFSHNSATQL